MYANIFFGEGVYSFHQTLKGAMAQKFKNSLRKVKSTNYGANKTVRFCCCTL